MRQIMLKHFLNQITDQRTTMFSKLQVIAK
jgi:hypothetical protein